MSIIDLLVTLIVFCVIAGIFCTLARALLAAGKVDASWANVAYALLCLLLVVLFLMEVGWVGGSPHAWRHGWR